MARPRQPRPRKRVPGAVIAGAAIVFVVVAALTARALLGVPTPRAESPAPEPIAQMPVEPAPRPTELVSFEQGCSTPACHASYAAEPIVHGPIAQGACAGCHLADTGGHVYPVAGGGNALCTACHDLGPTGPVEHLAVTEDGCLACHDPHASANAALLRAASLAETCGACHTRTGGAVGHEPYAESLCIACHEPHSGMNPLLLRGEEASDHCAMCHAGAAAELEASPHGHDRIDGSCLRCHAGHASEHDGLLTDESGAQCLRCHDSVRETIQSSRVAHRGAMTDRACLTCHAPHASPERSMLRASESEICLACHAEPVEAIDGRTIPDMRPFVLDAAFEHGPVRGGDCGACHSVHGSSHDHLLREKNPETLVGSFDLSNYALCFACHTPNLVLDETTEVATAFRDGDLNLHRLHVANGGKSRSCSNCHVVHGGNRPRLMADFPAFEGSGWRAPLGFVINENGGSCAPGCHEPRSYGRGPGAGGGG